MKNARILADRGGAILLPEGENMGQKLYDAVKELLEDQNRREQMSVALKNMVVLDSAQRICDIIQELAGQK
jgi:UDP-N-acetylglucosamine--N-acetylmuramyl-(pentapeptide) pyrophosphoryl-undecaprenol N-acetylglucosamine transferase